MDSPTKLRKSLKKHTQGTRFGYGIDMSWYEGKVQILPCSAMFTWWIMCLFQLRTFDFRLVFICQRAPAKLECFFSKRVFSTNIDFFDIDSSGLHLTFVAFYLFSDIRKQYLKQCNYSVDQSALLIGFRTDFTSSVLNLCRWVADVPPRETSPAAKCAEKRMFSQANSNRMKINLKSTVILRRLF